MKYFYHKLLAILILPFSIYASDIYYCVDDAATGFNPKENFAVKQYTPERFKIMIDLEQNMVQSTDLYLESHNNPKCIDANFGALNCINSLGVTFVISKTNLKYFRSSMFNPRNPSDDIFVAHGSCEKF
tara:strand:+ start:1182 stop:1568 length:387 start_codon:yes stop_codon:yes gene_type:complete